MATQPVPIGYYSYNYGIPNYSFTPNCQPPLQPNLYTLPLNNGFINNNNTHTLNDSSASVQGMPPATPTLTYSAPFPVVYQPKPAPEPEPEQGLYYFYPGCGDVNSRSSNLGFYSQPQHLQPFLPSSMEIPIYDSAAMHYPQENVRDGHYYFESGNHGHEISNFHMIGNVAPTTTTPLTYFGTQLHSLPQAAVATDLLYPQYLPQPWEAPADQYPTWLCPRPLYTFPIFDETHDIFGMEGFPEPVAEEPLEASEEPEPEPSVFVFGQQYSEATGNKLETCASAEPIIGNLWTSHPVAINLHDYSATTILDPAPASETTQKGPTPRFIESGRWKGLSREMDTFSRSRIGCKFCFKTTEARIWYASHRLKDEQGRVVCPVLRKHVCQLCKKTGEEAHTIKFCPMYRNGYYRHKENNSRKKQSGQQQERQME